MPAKTKLLTKMSIDYYLKISLIEGVPRPDSYRDRGEGG